MGISIVYAQAMQQYWLNCGGLEGEPPYLYEPKKSRLRVSFLDFTQSLASCNASLPVKKVVALEPTNDRSYGPFQMVVLALSPILQPDQRKCRPGIVKYHDLPNWFGRGVVVPGEVGVRETVKFVITMNSYGLSHVRFGIDTQPV